MIIRKRMWTKSFSAIESEVKEARKKFNKIESKKSTRFTLD